MYLNGYKSSALMVLMHEAFTHVRQAQNEAYLELAQENGDIRGLVCDLFVYEGIIYPKETYQGTYVNQSAGAPPLHYSLIPKFSKIMNMQDDSGYREIKNLFIAILDISANGIVLRNMLPGVLVDAVQAKISDKGFQAIDLGVDGVLRHETEAAMEELRDHYADTLATVKMLLMDKLLLAR